MDQHVSDATALQILEEPKLFPGVTAQVQPVVDYPMPDGANPAQVLGYLQPITPQEMARRAPARRPGSPAMTWSARPGLEAQYNTALTGKPGSQIRLGERRGRRHRHRQRDRRRRPATRS